MWSAKRLMYPFARAVLLWQTRERAHLLTRTATALPEGAEQDKWKNPLSFTVYDSVRDAYVCPAGIVIVSRHNRKGLQDLLETHDIGAYWTVNKIARKDADARKAPPPALTA